MEEGTKKRQGVLTEGKREGFRRREGENKRRIEKEREIQLLI